VGGRAGARREATIPGSVTFVDGELIHFIESGNGPAVVLIHGFPSNTFVWSEILPRLSEHHRAVALDLPGLGYSHRNSRRSFSLQSHAETVVGLMDQLGIERATVVGLSMGGGVAERIAATFPSRVNRLVLLAAIDESVGAHWENRRGDSIVLSVALRVPPLARIVARASLRATVEDPAFVTPALVEGYVRPLLRRGTFPCLKRYLFDNRDAARADLSRITAPTLVLSGERDKTVLAETGRTIASKITGARYVVLERANHLIALERADDVFGEIVRFLRDGSDGPDDG